jgi:hypothetical protein
MPHTARIVERARVRLKVCTGRLRRLAANPWALPTLLLTCGVLYRVGWLFVFRSTTYAQGEMANVAIAFARTGVLADAFRVGQGSTAHVLPIPPIFAGLVYRAAGVQSVLSETLLATAALVLALAAFVLLYRVFGEMGTSRTGRLLGLAVVCLVPLSFYDEVVAFKIWEGQLATVLALGFLLGLLRLDRQTEIHLAPLAGMSVLAALLFFIHPPLGLAAYICALVCLVERLPKRIWPAAVAMAATALVVVVAPWAYRNMLVFGEFIPLRSDFGLELALANSAGAASTLDDLAAFRDRLREIHPFASQVAYDAMRQAGGEVPYSQRLGAEATAWILSDPFAFAKLCAKHLAEYFFPPTWEWEIYADSSRVGMGRLLADRSLHAIGLLGAITALVRAPRRYGYAVIMICVPAAVYMITQPILRYRYLMFGLITFFAADLIGYGLTTWPATRRWLIDNGIEPAQPLS